ncbi:ATP-dependent acyl-CoA ligase [Vineibacter terrae]|uniref:ATP-dependent acyl-CoA ligase n=1 Tax=Vineibacter terrae TaxID=2586908 RepID=A0A5C8P9S8_9HYPH|nr:AMP-binding protein [Vineibacter terrae]TXL70296.1 ATP-dependent acyl-CoA ligase [Vineibacter terrae]
MTTQADTTDTRIPPREECVLRYVLERRAAAHPDRPYLKLPDGSAVSYGAFCDAVRRTAAGLAALGVKQGDYVNVWLPNTVDMVRVWFAINWLGAVYVPINTAYRGGVLAHVIANGNAEVMIVAADLVGRLGDIDRSRLRTLVIAGTMPPAIPGLAYTPLEKLDADPATLPPLGQPIEPWDTQSIIYTSGTTGRSKGVLSSYAHLWHMSGAQAFPMLAESDCYLVYLPFFHVGGTLPVVAMLNRGGAIGMGGDFTTEAFWPTVRATGATYTILLGVMSTFLSKRPPQPDDRDHSLAKVTMIPLPDDSQAFGSRFGCTIYTLFNMTEVSVPIVSEADPQTIGTCGRQREGVDLRIVDAHDREVPVGQVGELIVRTDAPWALNSGYHRNPEATAPAWRNGWFHTGDAFRKDDQGNYFFVDRMKDAIRRRGENISSFEVEAEILAYPKVRECAVVAVRNEIAEDDVLAIIAPAPGETIDPLSLLEFLKPRLAHFMLPRYFRIMTDLPKTPTQKVEKYVLRQQGLTAETWDREKAGVTIKREKIGG